jgi:hypothetical protein
MKVGIMQPYFFPYIGYYQLMNAVDTFVIYDNIEYTKKGWINRNRILVNGIDSYITLPLKKDSDFLTIKERYLSDDWVTERRKLLNRIVESYRKAPFFNDVFPIIEQCILFADKQLFNFIQNSLELIRTYLGITTQLIVSSTLEVDSSLKSTQKVIAICKNLNANTYINPIGGLELYSKDDFGNEGIGLNFLKTDQIVYSQFNSSFTSNLSIIDVMMFNEKLDIKYFINNSYSLL